MSTRTVYTLSVLALFVTVPWWFFKASTFTIFGFPAWAFYVMTATVVYSFVIAVLLQIHWKTGHRNKKDSSL